MAIGVQDCAGQTSNSLPIFVNVLHQHEPHNIEFHHFNPSHSQTSTSLSSQHRLVRLDLNARDVQTPGGSRFKTSVCGFLNVL